jgi:hypothetical protein
VVIYQAQSGIIALTCMYSLNTLLQAVHFDRSQ